VDEPLQAEVVARRRHFGAHRSTGAQPAKDDGANWIALPAKKGNRSLAFRSWFRRDRDLGGEHRPMALMS
jgi:hypothetical protein